MKQQQQCRIVFMLVCMVAFLVIAVSGSVVAREIFSWTDENGIMHYSDFPPGGQQAQIIDVGKTHAPSTIRAYPDPGDTRPDTVSEAVTMDDADGQESGPSLSIADAKREQMAINRKKRREAQAEVDRMCVQHRQRLARVEPHRRVFYTDESGETVRMDDDKRIALVEESRDFLANNCD